MCDKLNLRTGFMKDKKGILYMIFDSHAHYDDEAFEEDRNSLLSSMQKNGIGAIVNVGAGLESSRSSLALAETYDFIYAAVGVHPSDTDQLNEENYKELCRMLEEEKAVAVGEIGLDYYWDEPEREIQKKWFVRQLHTAMEKNKPVIIHSRDAAADTLDIMKAEKAWDQGGVIHCFSYSVEMAREYLNRGFYIGIGGVLTFQNAKRLKEVAEYAPLNQIVLETDCPYLAPVPNRGKRNSSLNLPYVAEMLAEIKGITREETERVTYENACRLYRIK